MLRYVAGAGSVLLLLFAAFFVWRGPAEAEDPIPPAPQARPLLTPLAQGRPAPSRPPEATEKSKEQRRFGRADRDRDGRISLAELYEPRRKAFAKLDRNGDGALSFEEWASSTAGKFAKADRDKSGWLNPAEYATTKPKQTARPKCKC